MTTDPGLETDPDRNQDAKPERLWTRVLICAAATGVITPYVLIRSAIGDRKLQHDLTPVLVLKMTLAFTVVGGFLGWYSLYYDRLEAFRRYAKKHQRFRWTSRILMLLWIASAALIGAVTVVAGMLLMES